MAKSKVREADIVELSKKLLWQDIQSIYRHIKVIADLGASAEPNIEDHMERAQRLSRMFADLRRELIKLQNDNRDVDAD